MTEATGKTDVVRTPEVDEVLRRIGWNLLLFQQIEHLLKHLMSLARFEGTAASAQANHAERSAKFHKQTLGQLAGQFGSDVLANGEERDAPENLSEPWFSFRFTMQGDRAFVRQYATELKAIVDARNDLIHHFLPRWSPASEKSTLLALTYLDDQRAKALPMRDRLQVLAKALQEAAAAYVEFFGSAEGSRELDFAFLRLSRPALLLGELTTRVCRDDGWTVLSTAEQIARKEEPEEFKNLAEVYGYRTIKKLLQATELFDFEEEPTRRGGTRTIYRINPRFELSMQPDQVAPGSGSSSQCQTD